MTFSVSVWAELPVLKDLQQVAAQAKLEKKPIILYMARTHCEFCARLQAEQLAPLMLNKNWNQRFILRKHTIDQAPYIKNIHGKPVSSESLAELYDIDLTPTLVFIDARGQRICEDIVGYNGSDFYALKLEHCIVAGETLLR